MDFRKEYDIKALAEQLRSPDGELGIKVGESMNKGNRLMNLETITQLAIKANDIILEIGMGNGFFVKDIIASASGVKYFGCDFSETMVKNASEINKPFAGNAQFVLTNADELPFGEKSFDKVFTVNTIYFWENAPRTLAMIRKVLKPGGILIITFRPESVMNKLPVVKYGFVTFSRDDVMNLLSENGFDILSATESEDVDIRINEQSIKNAFLIIKAQKK